MQIGIRCAACSWFANTLWIHWWVQLYLSFSTSLQHFCSYCWLNAKDLARTKFWHPLPMDRSPWLISRCIFFEGRCMAMAFSWKQLQRAWRITLPSSKLRQFPDCQPRNRNVAGYLDIFWIYFGYLLACLDIDGYRWHIRIHQDTLLHAVPRWRAAGRLHHLVPAAQAEDARRGSWWSCAECLPWRNEPSLHEIELMDIYIYNYIYNYIVYNMYMYILCYIFMLFYTYTCMMYHDSTIHEFFSRELASNRVFYFS